MMYVLSAIHESYSPRNSGRFQQQLRYCCQ